MTVVLGFSYDENKKTYYSDGHEREDVVKYCNEFILKYMEAERRSYRWLQIKETLAQQLEEDETGLPKNYYH